MKIVNGTLEDIMGNIELIRTIPKKANITESEIKERLKGRKYGVKLAIEDGRVEGIGVWYEDEGSLYLWLGAVRVPCQGLGSKILEDIGKESTQDRWYAKIDEADPVAYAHLRKFGFEAYKQENCVIWMERIFMPS